MVPTLTEKLGDLLKMQILFYFFFKREVLKVTKNLKFIKQIKHSGSKVQNKWSL